MTSPTLKRYQVFVALLALSVAGCRDKNYAVVVARLVEVQSPVSVKIGDNVISAEQGRGLLEGDVVSTGPDGSATIEFEGGNTIRLGSSTSLVMKKQGGTTAQFGAILLEGTARTISKGGNVKVAIGTAFGIAEFGSAAADFTVSAKEGVSVLVGTVEVTTPTGEAKTLDAGGSLTLQGIVVPLEKKAPAAEKAIVLNPLTFVLLGNPSQVQVKRHGEEEWRAADKRADFVAGDALRTRKSSGTRLQLGERAGLTLKPQTEMSLVEAGGDKQGERVRYALVSGGAMLEVERDPSGKSVVHEFEVSGQVVRVEPGAKEASVEVNALAGGKAEVTVRAGRATLASGEVVEAGSTIHLQKGQEPTAQPLAETFVELLAKKTATLYYNSDVPPVRFAWDGGKGPPPFHFELARDKEFSQIVVREELTKPSFIDDRLRPGRYFWRAKVDGAWQEGSVVIDKAPDSDCAGCKRTNIIDDTGENTVVYFQKSLPSITLRWTATPSATKYRVKVFTDGAFDRPLVDQTVAETTLALPAGRLPENKYYWLVLSLDEGGKEIAASEGMNSLTIAYDNAVADIEIRSPKSDSKVSGASLTTTGEVELGNRLMVNGKPVRLDGKGRFKETIPIEKGENQITYRLIAPNGAERFHVRRVYRR